MNLGLSFDLKLDSDPYPYVIVKFFLFTLVPYETRFTDHVSQDRFELIHYTQTYGY